MVCFLNIGRLLTHTDDLRIFVSENKPHIIDIDETKLDHAVIDGEVEIDENQIIRNDRNSFGGGVALYIHDSVPFTLYLANIFRGRIEYELIYSLRGAKHRVDYSVHIR